MSETKPSATARLLKAALLIAIGVAAGWALHRRAGNVPEQAATAVVSAAASAAPAAPERKVLYWYDPMQPAQHFDKPGKSPFMDMELVPKYADEGQAAGAAAAAAAPADALPALNLDARVSQSLGVRLARVTQGALPSALQATGVTQLNERDVSIVQSRTAGFVERVYGRAPGDVVAAGAPLAEVLVPEWAGAQAEYLAVKAQGDAALTQAARQRLALLGLNSAQLSLLDQSGRVQSTYTVVAPAAGVIQELAVRSGMTLAPGALLARINGLATLWIDAALPEAEAGQVQPGQTVEVRMASYPGQVFGARVAAVLPEGNRDTRTLRLRVELPNPQGRFKAGMSAQLSLQAAAHDALLVPAEAVIRTGQRALVYVAEGEASPPTRFRPVEVQVGQERGSLIEVLGGLALGQQVAASGVFLIDSEASMQGLVPAAASKPPGEGEQHSGHAAGAR